MIDNGYVITYIEEIRQFFEDIKELEKSNKLHFNSKYYIDYSENLLKAFRGEIIGATEKSNLSDKYLIALIELNRCRKMLTDIKHAIEQPWPSRNAKFDHIQRILKDHKDG